MDQVTSERCRPRMLNHVLYYYTHMPSLCCRSDVEILIYFLFVVDSTARNDIFRTHTTALCQWSILSAKSDCPVARQNFSLLVTAHDCGAGLHSQNKNGLLGERVKLYTSPEQWTLTRKFRNMIGMQKQKIMYSGYIMLGWYRGPLSRKITP